MGTYHTSDFYELAVEAVKEYNRFFSAIAVANEAVAKGENLSHPLTKLQESCRAFSDLLGRITRVCINNLDKTVITKNNERENQTEL